MKKKSYFTLFVAIMLTFSLIFTSCQPSAKEPSDAKDLTSEELTSRQAFDYFLKEEFKNSFEDDLISLHYTLKNPENYDIEKPEKAFSPLTKEYNEECKNELIASKDTLLSIQKNHLDEDQQILYETLEKYLEQQISLCEYPQFIDVLGANNGISTNLPLTLAEYSFYTEADIKDYLSILPEIPTLLEEAFAWEENRILEGYGLSSFEIEDTIAQIDRFLQPSDTNLLIETFETRLDALEGISEDQKKTYISNHSELIATFVIPAYENLKTNLQTLEKKAPEGKGLSHYENGDEYYELLIQSKTMSDRSISTLIKTLEKRMKTITKRITSVTMDTPEAYEIFSSTEQFTSESPEEILTRLKNCIKEDYPELPEISYKVEPIPEALQNNVTAAYYMIPPLDSTEENRIYYGKISGNSASLFMTLAHEGYPGHLYHQNYLLSGGLNPIYYILDITGYKEAWAYYTELDMADYCDFGVYDEEYHDALTELYRCNGEFSFCLSSLTDLYVNYKGYDLEAVENILTKYGLDSTSAEAFFRSAIEDPGTYLQYYIGYLELLSIRQTEEEELGNDFNEKQFHTELLEIGPCYFTQLTEIMKNQ